MSTVLVGQQHSIAREYSEELLAAIRNDFARPTVHARNLYHTSAMMYDIWTLYEDDHQAVFLGDTIGSYGFVMPEIVLPEFKEERDLHRAEVIAFACDRLLRYRFRDAPKKDQILERLDRQLLKYQYNPTIFNTDYAADPRPSVLGNYIASLFIEYGKQDGSNEVNDYGNTRYRPSNSPMVVKNPGNAGISNPNKWQPLAFDVFIGQGGNVIPTQIPDFLGPEWGDVIPFSLDSSDYVIRLDSRGREYKVYMDPGIPPLLTEEGMNTSSANYKWNFSLVGIWSSMVDPSDGVVWDISPGALGNLPALPTSQEEFEDFYNLFDGGDNSRGRALNPITNQPYAPQMVLRGDYTRVLAEFWADGPDSETPPGHWFTILHKVMDDPMFTRRWMGSGPELDPIEYDVKAFLTLGGAMHDAAIATWSIKGWHDYIRPVSAIRYMASMGQSTDSSLANYHAHGLPLIPDYIEVIKEDDPLATQSRFVGKIKIKAWRGPDFIQDPNEDTAGVGWIMADFWWPYQRPTFVSPPFAGYVSGHSTFSRAAAEVMTMMTGDEYFPGGMGIFDAFKNEFLVFEKGPSETIELQWATYRDASDQTSLSRIWGGIHPPIDDIPGRKIGIEVGLKAFNFANSFFAEVSTDTEDLPIVSELYNVFPNPVSSDFGIVSIEHKQVGSESVRVILYNAQGRIVRSELIRPSVTTLNVRGLRSGIYTMVIQDDAAKQVSQLIILD